MYKREMYDEWAFAKPIRIVHMDVKANLGYKDDPSWIAGSSVDLALSVRMSREDMADEPRHSPLIWEKLETVPSSCSMDVILDLCMVFARAVCAEQEIYVSKKHWNFHGKRILCLVRSQAPYPMSRMTSGDVLRELEGGGVPDSDDDGADGAQNRGQKRART